MTNNNVAFSVPESAIAHAITVAMSNSLAAPPRPPAPVNGLFTISPKRFVKRLEIGGGSKVNAWVDSMKASSPTQLDQSSLYESDEHSSWMDDHPSALQSFEEITNASKGKQIVMFLDYDGTLSPIVEDPDRAFMSREMRATVREVAKYFPTAIVTGRCRDKVYGFVKLAELYYAGSHGMDIKGPSSVRKYKKFHCKASQAVQFQPASEFLPMIDEVYRELSEKIQSTPGAKVENNKFCVSVHFRCVEEMRWKALAEDVRSVVCQHPELKLTQGKKVLEIRPTIKWDKGKALKFLLKSLGYDKSKDVFPIYIGDDRSDEDAFKVLRKRGEGFGILVSKVPMETNASFSLQEPSEVMSFLQRLVEWRRWSLQE